MLKEHYEEGKHQGQGTGVLVVFLVLLVFFAAFLILLYLVAKWAVEWI